MQANSVLGDIGSNRGRKARSTPRYDVSHSIHHSNRTTEVLQRRLGVVLLSLFALVFVEAAKAEVVVVANRTPRRVPMQVKAPNEFAWEVMLSSGVSRPIFCDGPVEIAFDSLAGMKSYTLEPGSVYFVGKRKSGLLDLQRIGLGETSAVLGTLPGSASTTPVATIPVKILVDDEEATRRPIWEAKLRKRVAAASDVLHRHAMVKLDVVAADTWRSDNTQTNFNNTLTEFERNVKPFPGEIAIGFSSQYEARRGRIHLGGTRGPLRPHILLREWSRHVSETEKMEILLHELGHYLGAGHSPEPDSVMRPVLGDRKSRRKEFVVKFDPVNTLLIATVGEEIRRRRVTNFTQVTPATKARIGNIYEVLGHASPGDGAANLLRRQLGPQRKSDPLVESVRSVLARITQFARANHRLSETSDTTAALRHVRGDELFERYIRIAASAASAASDLPDDKQAKAFLLAIGVGVGDPEQLKQLPALRSLLLRIESPAERSIRTTFLGKPTIQGRPDLARHFSVAAMLVASSGFDAAETLSIAKEAIDSQGGSGFSFADLAADKAGIAMAQVLLDRELSLTRVANSFRASDYVPDVSDLPEGMTTMQFMRQYGGRDDERFERVIREIDVAIADLRAYEPLEQP